MAAHPHLGDQIAEVRAIGGLRRWDQIARQRDLGPVQNGVRGHARGLPLFGDVPALGQERIDVLPVDLKHVLGRAAPGCEPGALIFSKILLQEFLIQLDQKLQLIQQTGPHVSVGIVEDDGQRIHKV